MYTTTTIQIVNYSIFSQHTFMMLCNVYGPARLCEPVSCHYCIMFWGLMELFTTKDNFFLNIDIEKVALLREGQY